MGWGDWVRGAEVEPSLYAADFANLGAQIQVLLDAGARVFHFDVGDGHFVPPVTIGPVVLRSIAPLIHDRGRPGRLPPDGRRPGAPLRGVRGLGRRQRHLPRRGRRGRRRRARAGPRPRARGGRRVQPGDGGRGRCGRGESRRRPLSLHVDRARLLRPGADAGGVRADRASARARRLPRAGGRRRQAGERPARCATPAPTCSSSGAASSAATTSPVPTAGWWKPWHEPGAGARARGAGAGQGVSEADDRRRGGRGERRSSARERPRPAAATARWLRSAAAGERARGATLYVTMEPCRHHGTTPPCVDAILAAGVARVVAGSRDPNPEARRRARAAARAGRRGRAASTASTRGARTRPGARGSRSAVPS